MDVPTIPARSIVIKNKSTAWFGTRYTMNIYRGCSHGCIYCDSRSECYGVQDFDTVRVKSDALAVIRNDLRSKTQGRGTYTMQFAQYEEVPANIADKILGRK